MAKKVFTDESLGTFISEIKSYTDEAVSTKADSSHTQAASTITAGTLGGKVVANTTAVKTLGNAQVRNIYITATDLTAGSSSLTTGNICLVYE